MRSTTNVNNMMAGTTNKKNNQIIWKRIAKEITDKKNIQSAIKIDQKPRIDLIGIIRGKMDGNPTD